MKKSKMERKLLKEIFNNNERNVIFNALCYSCHHYKKQGKIDEAVKVQSVINHVYDAFGIENTKYTKAEVDNIVDETLKTAGKYFTKKLDGAHKAGYEAALKDVSAGVVAIIEHKKNNEETAGEDNDNGGEEKPADDNNPEEKPEETESKKE